MIETTVSADRVAEMSKVVGENTKGNLMIGINHVRFEGAEHGRTNFSIRALAESWELMTFHVEISKSRSGTVARSGIDSFKTKQEKLLMVIPAGPKRMLGYKTYRLFMDNLAAAIAAEDSTARTAVVEREYA
jgi:hypothetical protein